MIDPNQCCTMDSRDDDGAGQQLLDRRRPLCDGDNESVGSLASVSSWLSIKLMPAISSNQSQEHNSPLLLVHENKPFYGHEKPVILHLKQDGLTLASMPPFIQSSRPFVLAAVRQNGLSLQYASRDLRDDVKIAMTAVSQNGLSFQYASSKLRSNASVCIVAVSQNGQALQYASRQLRGNKKIVLAAVLNDGKALEYASSTLRNEEDVVLTAVRRDKAAVRYLGHEYLGKVKLDEIMKMATRGREIESMRFEC